jgi:hypothetical protein
MSPQEGITMDRRGFFTALAGAALVAGGLAGTTGSASALPASPEAPKVPDWSKLDAQYYYRRRRRCRRVWNGYRWVLRCW